jgi:hypothetical protein
VFPLDNTPISAYSKDNEREQRKPKEEFQMKKIMTVERVVDLFHIVRVGDKLKIFPTDFFDDECKAFIVSHKSEIEVKAAYEQSHKDFVDAHIWD